MRACVACVWRGERNWRTHTLPPLPLLMLQVVYEWARGTPFQEICTLTDVMEGSIVRAIVRLDETCR